MVNNYTDQKMGKQIILSRFSVHIVPDVLKDIDEPQTTSYSQVSTAEVKAQWLAHKGLVSINNLRQKSP